MPEANGKSKILPVIQDSTVMELVKYSLKDEDDFTLVEQTVIADGIQPQILRLEPNIVLLDFNINKTYTYNIIDNIALQFPEVAVVVILQESTANVSDGVILSGARAFIQYPFSKEKFLSTLRRVVELAQRKVSGLKSQEKISPLPEKPKNTIIVFSPKGGTGCTTIAINLAIALHQLTKKRVLLMDGKPIFGDIALSLNIRTSNSISDLISHAGMLDEQLINQVVVEHASGISVLPGPINPAEAQGIHAEDLFKVLTQIQAYYPVVVIDGGNYMHENTVTLMDASNKIVVVMNANLAAIRNVRQFMDVCQMLSYPPEKIMLVLNDYGKRTDIRREEIEKILKQKITCLIPSDSKLFVSALNEGVPALLKNSRLPAIKIIQKFAVEINEEILKKNTLANGE
jgi:pilus assembly protein CpaE